MVELAETLIIGSGPAGLATAIGYGQGALVLEKLDKFGGLSSSIEFGGTIFDLGGHSFHTPHPDVRKLVYESCEMFEQVRVASCYSHGDLIPYPFQKHFDQLSNKAVVEECRNGLVNTKSQTPGDTFHDYLLAKFGPGIAKNFLVPYNQKLWGTDLKRIGVDWVSQRIYSNDSGNNAEMNGGEREPLNDRTVVAYPARGGFGELTTSLARKVPQIRRDTEVIHINVDAKLARTKCGTTFKWQNLVSTMPLDRLLSMMDCPVEIRAAGERLETLSLALVMVVLDSRLDTPIQRVYCADSSSPAHKIALTNNSSDYLRSFANHGILGEVCMLTETFDRTDLERSFVESLVTIGLIQKIEQVREVRTICLNYGYPIPTHDGRQCAETIRGWLREGGIYSVGRFGEHAYINSDEAIWRGLQLGRSLVGGKCLQV